MKISATEKDNNREERRKRGSKRERGKGKENMPVAGTRKLCRVGLAAILVTALCILTLLDSPPARLPDPPTDPPPTPGKQFPPSPLFLLPLASPRRARMPRPLPFCYRRTVRHRNLKTAVTPRIVILAEFFAAARIAREHR